MNSWLYIQNIPTKSDEGVTCQAMVHVLHAPCFIFHEVHVGYQLGAFDGTTLPFIFLKYIQLSLLFVMF